MSSSSSPVAPTSNIISPEPNSPLPSVPPTSQSMDVPSSPAASSSPRSATAASPEPPLSSSDPQPTSTSAPPPPAPSSNSPIIPSLPAAPASPSPSPPPPAPPAPLPSAPSSPPPTTSASAAVNQPLFPFVRSTEQPVQQSELSIAPLISNAATFISTADAPSTTLRPSLPNQPITETAASVSSSPAAFVNPLSAVKASQTTTRGTASSAIPVPGLGNVSQNSLKSGEGVGIGAIVGIVVGCVVGAALLGGLAVCWIRRKKFAGKKEADAIGSTFWNKEVLETQSFLVADEAASSSSISGGNGSSSVMMAPADDGREERFLSHVSNQAAAPGDACQHEQAIPPESNIASISSSGTVPIAARTKRESKHKLGKKVSKQTSDSGSSVSERAVVTPADISRAYQQHRPKPTVQQIVTSDNAPLLAESGQISSASGVSASEQNQAFSPVYGISQDMAQQYMYGMTYEQQQEQLRYYMQNQAYLSPPDVSGMSQEYINSWWQAYFQHDPVAAQECYEAALKAQHGGGR
ncbi:hypothetical protein HDU81_010260 [Chytriomyces hyalinus]|nr:hypothetical protein HDU81_010260 [Chytriomyces hyalinus]